VIHPDEPLRLNPLLPPPPPPDLSEIDNLRVQLQAAQDQLDGLLPPDKSEAEVQTDVGGAKFGIGPVQTGGR
jgi:hypothetical protein